MKIRMVALLVMMAGFVRGADPSPEPEPPRPPKADIRGKVTAMSLLKSKAYLGRLTIDGKKEKDTTHQKASVRVLAAAKVWQWKDGKKTEAKFEDIKAGDLVQCVFSAPVPAGAITVSARSAEILILPAPKK